MSLLDAPPMTDQDKAIDDLQARIRELEGAARERDAVADVKWRHQAQHNQKTDDAIAKILEVLDTKFGQVFAKLGVMDRKLAAIAALAGLAGTALAKYVLP